MAAAASYILGMLVTFLCGILLARGYRQSHQRLLLWSSICFLGLALHSALIFTDLVLLPSTDLHLMRRGVVAVSMIVLIYGLIWDSE
jgi:hypothetical protein